VQVYLIIVWRPLDVDFRELCKIDLFFRVNVIQFAEREIESMRKQTGQMSFAEGLLAQRHGALDNVLGLVDWVAVGDILKSVHGARVGRPGYGPLVLLRCILLQTWYELSDPGLEEALADRLSFRRFVGLSLSDAVPDHSTLSRFRKHLCEQGLSEPILKEVNRQLEVRGLVLKRGTLIDASLIEAHARKPATGEGITTRSDQDATWHNSPRKGPVYGYKAHVAVDEGSGLVRQAILTPANVSDKTPAVNLVQGDEATVYADKGYDSGWIRLRLQQRGIADGIMKANYAKRRLTEADKQRNREISPIRASVERTFATLKQWYGYHKVRYRSLSRNNLQLQVLCIAMNLKRALVIVA
jgi:transposase, IS5 family